MKSIRIQLVEMPADPIRQSMNSNGRTHTLKRTITQNCLSCRRRLCGIHGGIQYTACHAIHPIIVLGMLIGATRVRLHVLKGR